MHLLPESTYLGKLNILEVYEAYDEPCLFTCQNASGQIFLVVLIDENEDYKKWVYVALSQKRFEYVRSGGIDLHDSFKSAEDEYVHIVKVPFFTEEGNSRVAIMSCEDLSEDMLPLSGEFIKIETQTLPVLSGESLEQGALSIWREILRFRVKFPAYSRNEAPIKLWGNMLSSLQEVVDAVGRKIESETGRGAGRKVIAQQTELLATVTSGGSYSVDLISSASADVLRNSLVGESLYILFNLINASNTNNQNTESIPGSKVGDFNRIVSQNTESIPGSKEEDFNRIVSRLGRQFASRYRGFLKSIADAESDISFDWGSPHPDRGGSATLTYMNAINSLYLISKMEIAAPEILEVTGILIGGNIESKRFELRDIYDDFKYKGEIYDSLLTSNMDMVLEDIYKATLEEAIEVNKVTGETKPKYKLVGLERLKLAIANDAQETA